MLYSSGAGDDPSEIISKLKIIFIYFNNIFIYFLERDLKNLVYMYDFSVWQIQYSCLYVHEINLNLLVTNLNSDSAELDE